MLPLFPNTSIVLQQIFKVSIIAKLIFVYKTKCDVICINMWNFKIICKEFYLKLPEKLQV